MDANSVLFDCDQDLPAPGVVGFLFWTSLMSVKQKKKQNVGGKGQHAAIYLDRFDNSLDDARRCDFGCWRCDPEIHLWSYLLLSQTEAFIHCTLHHIIYCAGYCIINTLFTTHK